MPNGTKNGSNRELLAPHSASALGLARGRRSCQSGGNGHCYLAKRENRATYSINARITCKFLNSVRSAAWIVRTLSLALSPSEPDWPARSSTPKNQFRQLVIDLDHIDTAIHIFFPSIELEEIKSCPVPAAH